jgi:hypothetical protein
MSPQPASVAGEPQPLVAHAAAAAPTEMLGARAGAAQPSTGGSVAELEGRHPSLEPSEDEIRLRAYQRYLERGGEHGRDFDDWVAAEQELRQK